MCIAILKTIDGVVTKEQLENSYKKNKDGCGYTYVDNFGNIQVYKSMSFPIFYEKLMGALAEFGSTSPFIIHFRIATEGGINLDNCHPFMVTPSTVFCHNGMIGGLRKEAGYSDTRIFNLDVLKNLDGNFQDSPAIMKLLELSIGNSKLIFLNDDYSFNIVAEKKGDWVNGTWFSNTGYKTVKPPVTTGYGTGYWDATTQQWVAKPMKKNLSEMKKDLAVYEKRCKGNSSVMYGDSYIDYWIKKSDALRAEIKKEESKCKIVALPKTAPPRNFATCMYCEEVEVRSDMHPYHYEDGDEPDLYCTQCIELLIDSEVLDIDDVPTYLEHLDRDTVLDQEETLGSLYCNGLPY